MLSLAAKWGWRSDNPVRGIERSTKNAASAGFPYRELSQLLVALLAHPNQRAANAARFQIWTGGGSVKF
jgi:hypothetical protein